ncbi:hypothetical protein BOTBODRAFT_36092 [Botryobasidium botryosum FD-172 SS1]|uniref:Methyltransferase domain-containing protein n=1 Tax=Botryobasidium botryosum (strain FD-172 SS1) TaxID=930990 RepID=A0A067MFB5_BOTB1|nr:hypothetical protein BOTBODRAFT_36092 [Botryobasidium botryosum FD-172 SS1]
MPALGRVHPRFVALVAIVLFSIFFILGPPLDLQRLPAGWTFRSPNPLDRLSSLPTEQRIALAEELYQDVLDRRAELVRRFGPTVEDVEAFPTPSRRLLYTLWDFFVVAPTFCAHRMERIGTFSDGGKWVCGLERIAKKPDCVVYSFGVNDESSFEAEILGRTNCTVYGYDFSVTKWGPEISDNPALSPRAQFFPYGISGKDTEAIGDSPPMYTLSTLMKMNNHTFIDILKIDIEGSEFDTLSALLAAYQPEPQPQSQTSEPGRSHSSPLPPPPPTLPFGQLQIEIHAWAHTFAAFHTWWTALEDAGLRPFWTEPNLVYVNNFRGSVPTLAEYSFVNIRGGHDVVSDRRYY